MSDQAPDILSIDQSRSIRQRSVSRTRPHQLPDEPLEQLPEERDTELTTVNERLVREIRARERTEEALRQNNAYLTALNDLLELTMEQAPFDSVLQRALRLVLSLPAFGPEVSGIVFVVEEPDVLTVRAARGTLEKMHDLGARIPMAQCLCGQAARGAELMHMARVGEDDQALCGCSAEHLHCCLPFRYKGEVLGVLSLFLDEGWSMEEWEIRVLGGVADALAGIIARLRGEQERAALVEQLHYSQRMEAVGRLAGGVAHDFNNLLTVIQGNVYLNLSEPGIQEPLRSDLEGIEEAANRAATLTRQLLAFGRKQVLRPQQLEANQIVRELEKMLRRVLRENVELVLELQSAPWTIQVDPGQIEQVLLGLVVNARDAMPSGGELRIVTENVTVGECERCQPGAPEPGEYVRLCVRDDGIGMDSSTLERAFEPFFTTKEVGAGSGLGLSTAYGIVRQSDGYIRVNSAPGQGTEVEILLPRVLEMTESERLVEVPASASAGKVVLLVEDEPSVQKLASRVLEAEGYTVLRASNGRAAIELARHREGPIDLLLTDVVMPGMGGAEVAKQLRALRPGLRVLYVSGYTGEDLCDNGVPHWDAELLEKPFGPRQLVSRVQKILDLQG